MTQTFRGVLFRWEGPNAWTFVEVPEVLAPPVSAAWGRTPVRATVDGVAWDTSVWRDKGGRTLLAVPKKVRRGKGDRDEVDVAIEPR